VSSDTLVPAAAEDTTPITGFPEGSWINYTSWSPDGKHITFTTRSPGACGTHIAYC
jgi:Tol biopolymer transport system component